MTPRAGFLSAVVLCGAFLIGCQEHGSDPLRPDGQGPQLGHKPNHKPGGDGEPDHIPVNVTFSDRTGDGVLSDQTVGGSKVYSDGDDNVSAHLRGNGHFRLFTAFNLSRKQEASRRLCYDFGWGAGGIPGSFTGGQGCDDLNAGKLMAKGLVTSNPLDANGDPVADGMLGMAPGDRITMRSSTYFEADGFGWFLRYGRDCDLNDVPHDHPSRVTVAAVSVDEWTMEASGPAILCKTPLKGKGVTTEVGPFTMPFELTVERQ